MQERPASEKRQGTKSRLGGHTTVLWRLWGFGVGMGVGWGDFFCVLHPPDHLQARASHRLVGQSIH
jgi:hypothetical protein